MDEFKIKWREFNLFLIERELKYRKLNEGCMGEGALTKNSY